MLLASGEWWGDVRSIIIIIMSQVGMLENNIVVIGGEKRPSNTLETFDLKVSCLVVSIIETKGFTD